MTGKPLFEPIPWTQKDRSYVEPFFSNVDKPLYTIRNMPSELSGALCSRASRAKGDLRQVFLEEYVKPILNGPDKTLARELTFVIAFLQKHNFRNILNNQRAQQFFAKWLAQYGDESIMQMLGTYLAFSSISQVAIKFLEDQRIGLAPIEKSTRYVDFSSKINGHYRYYTPPEISDLGYGKPYRETMDALFISYRELISSLKNYLMKLYPEEREMVLEKKAFDTLRGLLPMATLGQVAFFGNAQAFEHMINRCARFPLKEFQWIAHSSRAELDQEIPSLLLRLDNPKTKDYQNYLASKFLGLRDWLSKNQKLSWRRNIVSPRVNLVEYDPHGENKILSSILFPESNRSWKETTSYVRKLSLQKKKEILSRYLGERKERWQRAGRALENVYVRFEIVMNIGAWRDLHRHRMQTQARQLISCHLGFDTPREITKTPFEKPFVYAMERAAGLFKKLEKRNPFVAQYVVPLAYRVRFYQWANLRQCFWETELRTTSQGHPDYRQVEQQKYHLLKKVYPRIAEFMMVDMNAYDLARRGSAERARAKEEQLLRALRKSKK